MKRYITLALSVLMVLNSCSQMLDYIRVQRFLLTA